MGPKHPKWLCGCPTLRIVYCHMRKTQQTPFMVVALSALLLLCIVWVVMSNIVFPMMGLLVADCAATDSTDEAAYTGAEYCVWTRETRLVYLVTWLPHPSCCVLP